MIRILTHPEYKFIEHRSKAFLVSIILIAVGIVSLVMHGGPNYSIDFTGGTLLEFRFEDAIDLNRVRQGAAEAGLESAEIQRFGDAREIILRTQELGVEEGQITTFISRMREVFADSPFEVMRTESVGPKIGGELKEKALLAILYSMIGLVIYISWRYEFKFAVAAIIALIHDVMITLGAFSLMDHEISLGVVAAFLTIVGYSLNDTIVVFDRIREVLQIRRKSAYAEVLDMSINQTLSRTIITSVSTLIVVLSLYLFGGEVIKDFAFALIVGVVVGTYSSIYVASPLLLEWNRLSWKKEA
jgi:preprotein translocase SecF subunit